MDVRWAKGEEQLDLQDPRFADAVADIASTIRGIPKDELASEEVRQHRRTVRTAWAAGAVVTLLAVVAVWAGFVASQNAEQAQANAAEAERLAALAQQNANEAAANAAAAELSAEAETEARQIAEDNAQEAVRNERVARARELAAAAGEVRAEDPELAVLLGLIGLSLADETEVPLEVGASFRESLYSLTAVNRLPAMIDEAAVYASMSPDGSRLAVLSEESVTLRLLDTTTWQELWSYSEPDSPDFTGEVHFSSDGSRIAFTVVDSSVEGFDGSERQGEADTAWARVIFLDADSGEHIQTVESELPCPGILIGPQSPNGRWWPVITSDDPDCSFGGERWSLHLYEATSFEPVAVLGPATPGNMSWSSDSSRLSFDSFWGAGAKVYEVESGELLFDQLDVFFGELSPDGTQIATADFETLMVTLWDIESGRQVDRFEGMTDIALQLRFSADGTRLFAGSRGENVAVWSLESGRRLNLLGGISNAVGMGYDDSRSILHVIGSQQIVSYDLSGNMEGEFGTVRRGLGSQANAFASTGSVGAALAGEEGTHDWQLLTFDASNGGLSGAVAQVEMGRAAAVLPDGRIALFRRQGTGPSRTAGPVALWDPVHDIYEDVVGCEAPHESIVEVEFSVYEAECLDGDKEWFDGWRFHVDPSLNELLIMSSAGEILIYDAVTLELKHELSIAPTGQGGVEAFGRDWIAVSTGSPAAAFTELKVFAIPSLEELASFPGGLVALTSDAGLLATPDRRGGFSIYDTSTWRIVADAEIGDGRIRGLAFSPNGSKLMTSATDLTVRVWDVETGVELHRIPLGLVGDGHWLDEEHLFVEFQGLWTTVSLNLNEVAELAVDRLTRGLTEDECASFRIDPCPSLEDLRSG